MQERPTPKEIRERMRSSRRWAFGTVVAQTCIGFVLVALSGYVLNLMQKNSQRDNNYLQTRDVWAACVAIAAAYLLIAPIFAHMSIFPIKYSKITVNFSHYIGYILAAMSIASAGLALWSYRYHAPSCPTCRAAGSQGTAFGILSVVQVWNGLVVARNLQNAHAKYTWKEFRDFWGEELRSLEYQSAGEALATKLKIAIGVEPREPTTTEAEQGQSAPEPSRSSSEQITTEIIESPKTADLQ